jgi:hypothetical protein
MPYQQYNDPAKLILDICQPKWSEMSATEVDNLLSKMSQLGLDMANDKEFKRSYTRIAKEKYLFHIHHQQEENYIHPTFEALDKEIREKIKETQNAATQTEVLIPEYADFNNTQMMHVHTQKVRAKIAQLRNKKPPQIITPNQRK